MTYQFKLRLKKKLVNQNLNINHLKLMQKYIKK